MQVCRATGQVDEVLESWQNLALPECRCLILDARYGKILTDGQIRDGAVLIAKRVTDTVTS